jgi:hypothetical protein
VEGLGQPSFTCIFYFIVKYCRSSSRKYTKRRLLFILSLKKIKRELKKICINLEAGREV